MQATHLSLPHPSRSPTAAISTISSSSTLPQAAFHRSVCLRCSHRARAVPPPPHPTPTSCDHHPLCHQLQIVTSPPRQHLIAHSRPNMSHSTMRCDAMLDRGASVGPGVFMHPLSSAMPAQSHVPFVCAHTNLDRLQMTALPSACPPNCMVLPGILPAPGDASPRGWAPSSLEQRCAVLLP
jgi:hypothetical protein